MAMIPFVVEDGTGLPDATAYDTVENVSDYIETFYNSKFSDWDALSQGAKESAIMTASMYIDQNNEFLGMIVNCHQGLKWPRCGVCVKGCAIPSDVVPDYAFGSITKATAEYAWRAALEGPLNPDPSVDPNGRIIEMTSCCSTTKYSERYGPVLTQSYPTADKYLKCFKITGGRLIRG